MKLNLLLSLGVVAVNAVVGKVIIPWKSECEIEAEETPEQTDCSDRNGYFIHGAPIDGEGQCSYKYACFLPSGAKKIFPFAIKAQDPSECIELRGKYYCSADLNNIPCENCTFSQFVYTVYETFGRKFDYEDIDVSKIKTPIELPTETDEKIKCVKEGTYNDEEIICKKRDGLFFKMSFYPDCDQDYYACFLPNDKKVTSTGTVAQNLSECITIDGFESCSIDYTNVSCPEGKECTFTEYVQELSHVFGDYFSYEKSTKSSTEAVSIPEREYCTVGNYQYYPEESNCDKRDGKFVYGAPLNDDGECDYKYACFLPSGNARLFPDAFKAEEPSECINIYGEIYCSADLNNIGCPDCTFPQFVEKVKDVLDYEFDYEPIDAIQASEPILLPKDVTPQNIECTKRKDLPEAPYDACRRVNGEFFNKEFYPDCETTYYTCFIPKDQEPKETAIKAQDLSECITLDGYDTVYCAADYYSGVTCPEGKETCSFTEYVQEMARIYGDYFDYQPYNPNDTDVVTDYTEDYTDAVEDYTEYYTEYYTEAVTDSMEDYTEAVTDSI